MKNPKVTVIMAVYNGEKFLKEAIDSILNQTYKDLELIIINDASTDKTEDIIKKIKERDKRICLINNESNIGPAAARNRGLKIAKGEYIAIMDSDDVSMPERLEKEVVFLDQKKNIGLVGTYYLMINEKGKVLHAVRPPTDNNELKEKLLIGNEFGHGSVMFRRACIEKIGFYREEFELSQDYDFCLRIVDFFDVANIPELLYNWRLNTKSISVVRKAQQDKYALLAIELAKERRQFGKDRLQIFKEEGKKDGLNDLLLKTQSPSRMEIAESYYLWGEVLFKGNAIGDSIKILLRALIYSPLHRGAWVLIFEVLRSFFPKQIITLLRNIKQFLTHKKHES